MPREPHPDPAALERIDPTDPGADPVQVRLHLARYEFAQAYADGARVLDLGCGTGYGARMLAEVARGVVAIDSNPDVIEMARRRSAHPRVTFMTADAADPPDAGPFDLITCFEVIEHVADPNAVLRATRARLDPSKGSLIVSTPCRRSGNAETRPANPFHVREWNLEEFRHLLGNFFVSVQMYGQLVEFAPLGFPFSRSLAKMGTRLWEPRRLSVLGTAAVVPLADAPKLPLRMAAQVAVCQGPKGAHS